MKTEENRTHTIAQLHENEGLSAQAKRTGNDAFAYFGLIIVDYKDADVPF